MHNLPFLWCVLSIIVIPLQPDSTGIEGRVYRTTGNLMPAPGHPSSPHRGAKTTLYVYELTNIKQVTGSDGSPYYSAIKTRLVRQTDTDSNGYFKVLLPPGLYSLFTKKGDLYYAGRRDDKNNIAPVEVTPGKMTRVDFRDESEHRPVY